MRPIKLLHFWHLCSLDAPSVAVVWTWFVSRTFAISVPFTLYVAMFFGVWGLYVLDRLLDASPLLGLSVQSVLKERHLFHLKHRKWMFSIFFLCTLTSAGFALFLPSTLLFSYLAIVSVLGIYFAFVHFKDHAQLPKELVVGIFFSAATFLPSMQINFSLLSSAVLFAALCTLNGLFIQNWEGEGKSKPHLFAMGLSVICAVQATTSHTAAWQLPTCMAISLALYLVLHTLRHKLDDLTLRSGVDFSLLTPLLVFISST